MDSGCMICMEMFGNGARILGIATTTTPRKMGVRGLARIRTNMFFAEEDTKVEALSAGHLFALAQDA